MFKTKDTSVDEYTPAGPDVPRFEYLARNLKKVAGINLENDFNKHGREGWEFVAVADQYAIFKRQL